MPGAASGGAEMEAIPIQTCRQEKQARAQILEKLPDGNTVHQEQNLGGGPTTEIGQIG
ncbi:MAG: hypothetical protein GY753_14400 [Gammaproteobacteria bacterium]|nr:hypothetical protein [Gammaproteobacteria bacterium]